MANLSSANHPLKPGDRVVVHRRAGDAAECRTKVFRHETR